MIELEKRWYNGLSSQLGLDRGIFQISRPSPPLAPCDDDVLRTYYDAVPPASLIFDWSLQKTSRSSGRYALLANRIGVETYRKWAEFLEGQTAQPRPDQLPAVFLNWAMLNSPSVAASGASALAGAVLSRPMAAGTCREMLETLQSSSAARVSFRASQTGPNIADAWTGIEAGSLAGLWAGSAPDSPLNRRFAGSEVNVEAGFERYAAWTARSGRGFPRQRAIGSLVVVDEMDVSLSSDAVFSAEERAELESGAARGVWPFYVPDSGAARNSVTLGRSGGMQIRTATSPGNPAVIGANVIWEARAGTVC